MRHISAAMSKMGKTTQKKDPVTPLPAISFDVRRPGSEFASNTTDEESSSSTAQQDNGQSGIKHLTKLMQHNQSVLTSKLDDLASTVTNMQHKLDQYLVVFWRQRTE